MARANKARYLRLPAYRRPLPARPARLWEWPLESEAVGPSTPSPADAKAAPLPFEKAPVTKLPFFKFLYVDRSVVAAAQGRSGSVAVWTRSE